MTRLSAESIYTLAAFWPCSCTQHWPKLLHATGEKWHTKQEKSVTPAEKWQHKAPQLQSHSKWMLEAEKKGGKVFIAHQRLHHFSATSRGCLPLGVTCEVNTASPCKSAALPPLTEMRCLNWKHLTPFQCLSLCSDTLWCHCSFKYLLDIILHLANGFWLSPASPMQD